MIIQKQHTIYCTECRKTQDYKFLDDLDWRVLKHSDSEYFDHEGLCPGCNWMYEHSGCPGCLECDIKLRDAEYEI